MGMFSGINEAKTNTNGSYLTPGRHTLRVEAIRFKRSENPKSKYENMFIVEFSVVASDQLGTGLKRDWVLGIEAKQEAKMRAFGDIKEFYSCLAGSSDPQSLGTAFEAIAEGAIGASNPCRGLVAEVECYHKKMANGGDFTVHKWLPSLPTQEHAVRAAAAGASAGGGQRPALPPGFRLNADGSYSGPSAA